MRRYFLEKLPMKDVKDSALQVQSIQSDVTHQRHDQFQDGNTHKIALVPVQ